ncbi:hypothetical protein GALL_465590 [mine drainage metagenome]|uniref:Uncharacterized protein n=1 Tax=mine drainage metagenome TaxID=410659 RepID=A0A1J5Q7A0_9ZZZZ
MRSTSACRRHSRKRGAAALPSPSACSTSTISNRSTTPGDTRSATSCWSRSPRGCAAPCATTSCWRGWAATSSSSSSKVSTASSRTRSWPRRCSDCTTQPPAASNCRAALASSSRCRWVSRCSRTTHSCPASCCARPTSRCIRPSDASTPEPGGNCTPPIKRNPAKKTRSTLTAPTHAPCSSATPAIARRCAALSSRCSNAKSTATRRPRPCWRISNPPRAGGCARDRPPTSNACARRGPRVSASSRERATLAGGSRWPASTPCCCCARTRCTATGWSTH